MPFVYTRTQLKSVINRFVQNKGGMLVDIGATCNDAVRSVVNQVDLVSGRRKVPLVPNLFAGEFDYACPSDLNSYAIIDVPQQAKREDGEFNLVSSREFATNKKRGDIAIDDFNGQRILKINSKVADKTIVLSTLDEITAGGGTWITRGDGDTLVADPDDFIVGNGALKMSINAGGLTTAGIQNIALNKFDFTNYVNGNGAVFIWVKITTLTGLTNYVFEIGTDISNYYSQTVTTQNDGTAFVVGWNLLRFDMVNLTKVGTPTLTNFNYASVYMTKLNTKISESDYKFDQIILKVGKNANVEYYTNYGWQTAAGAYILESTQDTDLIVAGTNEFELICKKGIHLAAQELDLSAGGRNPLLKIEDLGKQYDVAVKEYETDNPSEAAIMTTSYYEY